MTISNSCVNPMIKYLTNLIKRPNKSDEISRWQPKKLTTNRTKCYKSVRCGKRMISSVTYFSISHYLMWPPVSLVQMCNYFTIKLFINRLKSEGLSLRTKTMAIGVVSQLNWLVFVSPLMTPIQPISCMNVLPGSHLEKPHNHSRAK